MAKGAAVLVLALAAGSAAAEPVRLRPGAYEVEVRLDLPHLDGAGGRKRVRLCLDGVPARGLPVLGDNTPLAGCPVSDLRWEGEALGFTIACEGRNQPSAKAVYRLAPEGFEGRVSMRLGGKNMTLTEVQTGRWRGACAPDDRRP